MSRLINALVCASLWLLSPTMLFANSNEAETSTTVAGSFEAGKGTFLLNGKPFVVKAAELHYPRIPGIIGNIE